MNADRPPSPRERPNIARSAGFFTPDHEKPAKEPPCSPGLGNEPGPSGLERSALWPGRLLDVVLAFVDGDRPGAVAPERQVLALAIYCLVDADRLTMNPHPDSTNFFAFPQRLSRSVELILSNAVTLEKARNSRHGNGNSR